MFGSMMHEFDEDPFFSAHREHMRRMEQMMGNFMNPFADMGFPRLMAPEQEFHPNPPRRDSRRLQAGHRGGGGALMPFGFGESMFGNMPNMFNNFERMQGDPNVHSYSSSSVYSYSTGEDGQPKVYQASSSTRTAPGGVKETRRTVLDSETATKKMAIGHHLDDRAHIVERSQTGKEAAQQEETHEYVNLEEEAAESFNREWLNRSRYQPRIHNAIGSENPLRRQYINDQPRALPGPSKNRTSDKNRKKHAEKLRNKAKHPKNDN